MLIVRCIICFNTNAVSVLAGNLGNRKDIQIELEIFIRSWNIPLIWFFWTKNDDLFYLCQMMCFICVYSLLLQRRPTIIDLISVVNEIIYESRFVYEKLTITMNCYALAKI